MKKRILSAIALTMALSMTLGMTAFAANSPSGSSNGIKSETIVSDETYEAGSVTVADDEKTALEAEAKTASDALTIEADKAPLTAAELKDAKTVAAKIAESRKIANANVTVLAGADITIANYNGVSFTLKLDKAVNPASTVVLHLNGNVWETLVSDVADDGKTITVYTDSLSPIVVVDVKAGETTSKGNGNGGSSAAASTPASPAESPKTGAVASAAGIMAGICVAGAAVSAKKVRKEN